MSDAARAKAAQHIRALDNDAGTWGVDFWGEWFPCDEESEQWVKDQAEILVNQLAKALDAYAAEQTAALRAALKEVIATLRAMHYADEGWPIGSTRHQGCPICALMADKVLLLAAPEGQPAAERTDGGVTPIAPDMVMVSAAYVRALEALAFTYPVGHRAACLTDSLVVRAAEGWPPEKPCTCGLDQARQAVEAARR